MDAAVANCDVRRTPVRRRPHYHCKSHWSKDAGRVCAMLCAVRATLKAFHSYDRDGRCKLHIEDAVREAGLLLVNAGLPTTISAQRQHLRVIMNQLATATRNEPPGVNDPHPTSKKQIEWVCADHIHDSAVNGPLKHGLVRREAGRGRARRGAGLLLDIAEIHRLDRVISRRIREMQKDR